MYEVLVHVPLQYVEFSHIIKTFLSEKFRAKNSLLLLLGPLWTGIISESGILVMMTSVLATFIVTVLQ